MGLGIKKKPAKKPAKKDDKKDDKKNPRHRRQSPPLR